MQHHSEGTVGHPSDLVQGTWKGLSYPIVNTPTMPELKLLGHKSFYLRLWLSRNNPDFTKTQASTSGKSHTLAPLCPLAPARG